MKEVVSLNETDYTGLAGHDFKFGFKIPKKCKYDTECMWICENMIDIFGISNGAVNSSQNYQMKDVKGFEDNFLTTLLMTNTDPLPPSRRLGEADSLDEEEEESKPLRASEDMSISFS